MAHAATQAEHQVERRLCRWERGGVSAGLAVAVYGRRGGDSARHCRVDRAGASARTLLDVVVGERAAILELLAGEDQALLVGRDALLVLDLRLHLYARGSDVYNSLRKTAL